MTQPQFLGRATISARLVVKTGLHVGAGKDKIEIGGVDNPVVRHPHSREPYVPGSSIKGKLRFMLEWAFSKIDADGNVWGWNRNDTYDTNDPILRIFGTALDEKSFRGGPTRLIVRDAVLNAEWLTKANGQGWELVEEKTEVVIDRIAGRAGGAGPRMTERVPAGAVFDLGMVFRLYAVDGDGGRHDWACLNWLLQGLAMLEEDALGGSGSRGYGRIAFEDLQVAFDGEVTRLDNNAFRGRRFDPAKAAEIVPCPFGA